MYARRSRRQTCSASKNTVGGRICRNSSVDNRQEDMRKNSLESKERVGLFGGHISSTQRDRDQEKQYGKTHKCKKHVRMRDLLNTQGQKMTEQQLSPKCHLLVIFLRVLEKRRQEDSYCSNDQENRPAQTKTPQNERDKKLSSSCRLHIIERKRLVSSSRNDVKELLLLELFL